MSGVDVLAVLDDLVADMGDTPGTTGHQVAQARAAVAELISAARDYADVEENAYCITQTIPARKRLAAAIANVTGGGK